MPTEFKARSFHSMKNIVRGVTIICSVTSIFTIPSNNNKDLKYFSHRFFNYSQSNFFYKRKFHFHYIVSRSVRILCSPVYYLQKIWNDKSNRRPRKGFRPVLLKEETEKKRPNARGRLTRSQRKSTQQSDVGRKFFFFLLFTTERKSFAIVCFKRFV